MPDAKLHHIGIAVESLDEALRFYRDALGLEAGVRKEVPAEKVEVAVLPAGDSRLELLEATGPDSPIAKFLTRSGPGLHHIALRVSNLDAAVERLRAAGRRLVLDEIRVGAEGYRYVFVHPAGSGGVLLELIEEA